MAGPAGVQVAPTDCHVRCIDPADAPDWCEDLLSESERARAGSLRRVAARRRFTTATALLKVAVAESADDDPRKVKLRRECPDCRGPHGHPEVVASTLNVSLTHAGDRVAVALCADAAVGVDVEQVIADVDVDSMLGPVLSDAERADFRAVHGRPARTQAFFHCWTRKESVLKATGDGLRVSMSSLTVWAPHDPARLTGFIDRPDLVGTAQIVDLDPGPGYVGAVTVLSVRLVRVRERDGAEAFAVTGFVR
jgi:4'-phosphopantetheinyl transferase